MNKQSNPIQATYKHTNSYMAKVHMTPKEKCINYKSGCAQIVNIMSFSCWLEKNCRGKNNLLLLRFSCVLPIDC